MNQPQQSPPPDPEHQARFQAAAIQEAEAMNTYLKGRVVSLNVEVQIRDTELATLRDRVKNLDAELDAIHTAAAAEQKGDTDEGAT